MNIQDIKKGDPVAYIPAHREHLASSIREENIGLVSSVSETYAFVIYYGTNYSQATWPRDLYSIKQMPHLLEKLGLKPTNGIQIPVDEAGGRKEKTI